jgi:NitT/TauT family transport system permease protein
MRRALDIAILLLVLLAGWQALHWIASYALTSPAETARRAWTMLNSRTFWPHAGETATAFVYSLAIAAGGGVLGGLLLGLNRTGSQVAEPILVSIYSLPKVTLYPLILLVFGLGLPAKVAFGAIHGIIPITLFAMNAVRNLPLVYLRAARSMRLTRTQILRSVVVPAAIPEIVSGLRIGFSLTLLGVLIGEMFASQRGLGYLIMNAIGLHDVPTMMAVVLLLAFVAVVANAFLLWLDRRLHHRVA